MLSNALFVVSLFSLALGKPLASSMRVLERRNSPPADFSYSGAAHSSTMMNLRIALAQSDVAGLEEALYDVSSPSSENYGKHLTKEEAASFAEPTSETLAAVTSWLESNGINATALTPASDWLAFSVSVEQANDLLDAQYNVYTHETTGRHVIRTMSYSVPAAMEAHVDAVYPSTTTTALAPVFKAHKRGRDQLDVVVKKSLGMSSSSSIATSDVSASCAHEITPSCLQSLYGIPTTSASNSSNTLGVSGFINQFANQADLKSFLGQFRTDISDNTTFSLQTLDGGKDLQSDSEAGVEANLDIQYTVGLATDVPVTFISVGEDTSDGDLGGFLDIINFLLNEDSPPAVLTTSYGDNEENIPIKMAVNLCNAYAQLGARGVSILFASGDGGVSGSQSQECTDFVPTFPSGCPYMTSVGATTGISPEVAASFSAGGFSNYFSTPSYQSSAVASYLSALGDTNAGLFNTSGRAYPDVSTQGANFAVVIDGQVKPVDGTSCASPTFASVVALLNDELVSAGKSTLGFLNPWLYSTASGALNDVTSGDNPGCETNGFPATTGWDPVTGLGTPNFAALRTAAGL
ncbi:family S53 protease-like protein [Laetiporus sulphureus 93-53]|uniref:tripeptidyl-peptidase II n=1 Tax=Laetiporus sulphureus 93-53 TaxID=1314785 RepID=A0A165GUQ6_9APHY|nr:family S53 protease-like protein [Laetiporus sulphureus 93-53]KZT10837.1 family S53 protease-like protein [Laetiporus sulphureus 93-53]